MNNISKDMFFCGEKKEREDRRRIYKVEGDVVKEVN